MRKKAATSVARIKIHNGNSSIAESILKEAISDFDNGEAFLYLEVFTDEEKFIEKVRCRLAEVKRKREELTNK